MSFVVKRRDLTDPAQLHALIVEHADDLERGLSILDSRLLLGQATIDLIGVDADGALVLIAAGRVADEEMFLRAVDAYTWCLEYPEAIRRLDPAVQCSSAQPPRVMFVVERIPDAFLRKIKQLGLPEVDCVEFRHFDVDGTAAVYFDTLARLRRSAIPPAPVTEQGASPATPGANGRPTSLKLQKLLGAERPTATGGEAAPVVRMVHRTTPRPEPRPLPSTPRAERTVVAPPSSAAHETTIPRMQETVAVRSVDTVALDTAPSVATVTAVPDVVSEGFGGVDAMVEAFATAKVPPVNGHVVAVNGHVEAFESALPEPEPPFSTLELAAVEPEPGTQPAQFVLNEPEAPIARPEARIAEPMRTDGPAETVCDVTPASPTVPADPVVPESQAMPADAVAAALTVADPAPLPATAPALEPAVVTRPEPELLVPALELEPRPADKDEPASSVPVSAADSIETELEPVAAAFMAEPVEPVMPIPTPTPSGFFRRPPPAVASRESKVAFAGAVSELLSEPSRMSEPNAPVSASRASVEEITRGALNDLVGATDKRPTDGATAFAKPDAPFAKRPRTIAPPPSDGQPIGGGPKRPTAAKGVDPTDGVAPRPPQAEAAPAVQGIEGLPFANDGVLTRQWMEFLNQMAAGK